MGPNSMPAGLLGPGGEKRLEARSDQLVFQAKSVA